MARQAPSDQYLRAMLLERNLSDLTVSAYRSDLRDLSVHLAPIALDDAEPEDLRDYLESLRARGLSSATMRRRMCTLRAFYAFLVDEGVLSESPAAPLRQSFVVERKMPPVMSRSEIQALLQAARAAAAPGLDIPARRRVLALRNAALIEVMFATGIRSGEAVALDVADYAPAEGTLRVRGKGRKDRVVYISSDEVHRCLGMFLQSRHALDPQCDAIMLNRYGRRLTPQTVRRVFQSLSRIAGIDRKFTPHSLRHSMATFLVENGADVRSVQEILGHSSVRTTEIYVAVSGRRQREVMRRFNQRDKLAI